MNLKQIDKAADKLGESISKAILEPYYKRIKKIWLFMIFAILVIVFFTIIVSVCLYVVIKFSQYSNG